MPRADADHTLVAVTSTPLARDLRFPKLRAGLPVLQRDDGEIQVGLDGDSALIFGEPRLRAVLECLDGAHHVRRLRELGLLAGLEPGEVDRVLRVLDEARLLAEGGRGLRPVDVLEQRSVRLIGAGPLGEAIARLLADSLLGRLWVVDDHPARRPGRTSSQMLSTRSEALRAALADRPRLRVDVTSHWSKPEGVRADLTVIATETAEADRLLADDLTHTDQPHLVVRSTGNAVVVGPLVIPGRTACLRCTDLVRRDADSAWPALLDQLTRLRLPADPTLSAWAATVAATQAVGYLRGGTPEACGATIELGGNDLLTRWRTWHPHPGCGCHWPSATQWGA